MTVTSTHRQQVTARIRSDVDKINAHFNENLVAPPIMYDIRGGSCCGKITSKDNYRALHLNAGLFIDNADAQINETAPHELAHWAEWKIYGDWEKIGSKRSVHGTRWKNIMNVLGVSPDRTASGMDTSNVKMKRKKKYEYKCLGTCGKALTLSSVAHNRIMRMTHRYSCNACGGAIQHVRLITQAKPASQDQPKRPTDVPQRPKVPKTGSKKARAQVLYDAYKGHGRAAVMLMFIQKLDMTQAGASTYYNTCKNA